jgi:hypothetical protein
MILPRIIDTIASILELSILFSVSGLVSLAALIWWLLNQLKALNELRNASGNPTFPRWPIFIFIYDFIYYLTMVPKEVMKAKQMAGRPPTHKSLALYFLFPAFALQSDLNEIAGGGAGGGGAPGGYPGQPGAPGGYPGQPGGYPGQPYG